MELHANSLDPNQTAPSDLQSDLCLHCLCRPVCLNTYYHYDTLRDIVQLLMSSRGFSLLIRVVIYQNVHLDE